MGERAVLFCDRCGKEDRPLSRHTMPALPKRNIPGKRMIDVCEECVKELVEGWYLSVGADILASRKTEHGA